MAKLLKTRIVLIKTKESDMSREQYLAQKLQNPELVNIVLKFYEAHKLELKIDRDYNNKTLPLHKAVPLAIEWYKAHLDREFSKTKIGKNQDVRSFSNGESIVKLLDQTAKEYDQAYTNVKIKDEMYSLRQNNIPICSIIVLHDLKKIEFKCSKVIDQESALNVLDFAHDFMGYSVDISMLGMLNLSNSWKQKILATANSYEESVYTNK